MSLRVAVYGAGGHGKVVAEILEAMGHAVAGFMDDAPSAPTCMGLPVVSSLEALTYDALVLAIGSNATRKRVFERLDALGTRWVNAIHPSAVLSPRTTLGRGVVIAAGAVINVDTALGDNAILNTGATLDHDNQLGPHAHVAPGCHLAGHVTVGEGAFLGIGTVAIPGVTVGAWATAGAGAVLVRDVPAQTTVIGVPARPLLQ